jgi:uncharacterized protein (TIGR02145 family)
LARNAGGTKDYTNESYDHRWANAGKYLKSKTGWTASGGIENLDTYGFSALPGGIRLYTGGRFYYAGDAGRWWTAAADKSGNACYRFMDDGDDNVYEDAESKSNGFSVRCVRG